MQEEGPALVLILDVNSEKGAQVRSNLCYLICLRHLMGSRAVKNRLLLRKDHFFRIQKGEGGNPEFSAALYKKKSKFVN